MAQEQVNDLALLKSTGPAWNTRVAPLDATRSEQLFPRLDDET